MRISIKFSGIYFLLNALKYHVWCINCEIEFCLYKNLFHPFFNCILHNYWNFFTAVSKINGLKKNSQKMVGEVGLVIYFTQCLSPHPYPGKTSKKKKRCKFRESLGPLRQISGSALHVMLLYMELLRRCCYVVVCS